MRYIELSKAEAEAINKDIKDNHGDVLDKFKRGGWTVNAESGALKNGNFTMSRELIEEIQKRGGKDATKIGGVDLKNRPDRTVSKNERIDGTP